LAQQIKPGR
jgi:hypothetical protein